MKLGSKFAINSVNTFNRIMEQELDKENSNSESIPIYSKRLNYPSRNPFRSDKRYSDSYSGRFSEIEIENEKSNFSLNQARGVRTYWSYADNNISGKHFDDWIFQINLCDVG